MTKWRKLYVSVSNPNYYINVVHENFSNNKFTVELLDRLGTMFFTPEEKIVAQDDEAIDMFFISMGDCVVSQIDFDRRNNDVLRLLTEGDHFGEISMIHKCKRTCTVISRNYNTMARITFNFLRNIFNLFPEYKNLLNDSIFRYKDPLYIFMKRCIKRLPFAKNLSKLTI